MPYTGEHSCRLIDPKSDKLKGADRVARVQQRDGSNHIVYFWGAKGKATKAVTQAKRFPTDKFSEAEARKKCTELKGILFEPAK